MNDLLERLDLGYIRRIGTHAGVRLREGQVVAMDYQPGNGTRYELVFTPLSALNPVGEYGERVPTGMAGDPSGVIVSYLSGNRVYPFHLLQQPRPPLAAGYLMEKPGHQAR